MAQINRKRKYTTTKLDADLAKELKELAKQRYIKNLAKREPSMPEITRLLRRTKGWELSKTELKIKPKREDIKI